jgi:peroxiredoxin
MRSSKHSTTFLSLVMIGTGLITLGLILFLELTINAAAEQGQVQELSAMPVAVNFPAPELSLTDIDGRNVSLDDYRGRVVLVNLWATWCPPCKAELPALQSFYDANKDQGFVIIGIDDGETADIVAPFVGEYGLTYQIWMDTEYETERAFGTINLPSSWVLDRQGNVVLNWVGAISTARLEEYVIPVIQE